MGRPAAASTAASGHEDLFPQIRLSGYCRLVKRLRRFARKGETHHLNGAAELRHQSLRRSTRSATSRDHKGSQGRRTVMITVSHREGPDPYGPDPLAADELR